MSAHTYCDGMNRRDFLRIGGLAGVGLSLAQYLQIAEAPRPASPLGQGQGGDLRPPLGRAEPHGHLRPQAQRPGYPSRRVPRDRHARARRRASASTCPSWPSCADKFAILRGVSHTPGRPPSGNEVLTTGNRPLPSLEYPGYGAVVSKELPGPLELPTFVAVPGGEETTGFLGVEYGPLNTGQTPRAGKPLEIRGLSLNGGITIADLDRRQNLLRGSITPSIPWATRTSCWWASTASRSGPSPCSARPRSARRSTCPRSRRPSPSSSASIPSPRAACWPRGWWRPACGS